MPEASQPETRDYPVIVHFRQKDPKTGKSVHYDPAGDYNEDTGEGWPGAKSVYTGVPGSDAVQELFDGAGGAHGPLIREPDEKTSEQESSGAADGEGDDDKSKPAGRRTAQKPANETREN